MAFTLETVKDYGGIGSDTEIQGEIDALNESGIYQCLTNSYGQAKADLIANNYVAGLLIAANDETQVTQERAASGASTSFKSSKYGDSGEYDNGRLARAYRDDGNGCLPIDDSQYCFGTAGKTFCPDNPQ